MSDEATRRRELRRRRILENAEERKKKIFGANYSNNESSNETENTRTPDEKDASPPITSTPVVNNEEITRESPPFIIPDARTLPPLLEPSLHSFPSFERNDGEINDADLRLLPPAFPNENGLDSVPEITEQLRNINNLLAGGGTNLSPTQTRKFDNFDVQSVPALGSFSKPIVPVILALFVCTVLSVNLGYVVSNSIALPFLLWEMQHLWCSRHIIEASSRGAGGLMGIALVLCGVQQSLLQKTSQIMTVVKCVFEDFSFYILTIVGWYWMLGLPGTIPTRDEFAEHQTMHVNAGNEEDVFELDDF